MQFIRGIVTEITRRGDTVVIKGEDTTMGRPVEVAMDVVVLSVGMEPSEGTTQMAEIFGLPLESHGFIETVGGALNTVDHLEAGHLRRRRLGRPGRPRGLDLDGRRGGDEGRRLPAQAGAGGGGRELRRPLVTCCTTL